MQSMCNCPPSSPFLWRSQARPSIFTGCLEFGAWNGKSKSQISTEAKDRFEAQSGRELAYSGTLSPRSRAA